nr:MAG TPA: hypothetical protein [Caudoviricetes sp.]
MEIPTVLCLGDGRYTCFTFFFGHFFTLSLATS